MSKLESIVALTIDQSFKLHRDWGPGLVESFYRSLLARSLTRCGLRVAQEVPITPEYEGENFPNIFRADLIVEELLLVELKSVELLLTVHSKQVLTYLRVMRLPLGLLLNLGSGMFRDGVRRIVNPAADLSLVLDRKSGLPAQKLE